VAEERIRSFIEKIKDEFEPELILLFGSRARGDALGSSDYDIIIVSRKFEKMGFRERIIKVYELVTEPLNVDVLCYTPEEFKEKKRQITIVKKAAEEGIVLYEAISNKAGKKHQQTSSAS